MVPPLIKISGSATVCQHFYDTKGISENSYYKNHRKKNYSDFQYKFALDN